MRLMPGDIMPDFTFDTPFKSQLSFSEELQKGEGKTLLVFLRYYGCTLCQFEIYNYIENYNIIKSRGGSLFIVLQSDPQKLASQLNPDELPFDLICDPEQKLYTQFEIKAASSKEEMLGPNAAVKIQKARSAGFQHGEYEGNELQLPAFFILDQDRHITHAHYAQTVDDMPDLEDIMEFL